MVTFAVSTLGCKVNAYESEGYVQGLLECGYREVSFKEIADIYIINTCAVTNTASAKSRQRIHQAKALNPNAFIAVVGCYVQVDSERLAKAEQIDILIGSDQKVLLPQLIQSALQDRKPQKIVHDVRSLRTFEALPISRFHRQTRAYLKIQDGCNQFCSYCIIPFARGAERSLPIDQAIAVAKNLTANQHREIVLSGIHTGRYGRDLGTDLLTLLKRMVDEVSGLERIRISSIEMNEISDELLMYMAKEPKLARHLHIPIQSGSDHVLELMHRPYRMDWFQRRVEHIRALMPDISISTDVIVGFPQESEEDFENTGRNLQQLQLSFLHVFPYSKRDHTAAADMSGHLDNRTKKQRAARLNELSKTLYHTYKQQFIHHSVDVLLEESKEPGWLFGHTSEYLPVKVAGDETALHTMKQVTLIDLDSDDVLIGE